MSVSSTEESLRKQLELFKDFLKTSPQKSNPEGYQLARDFLDKFPIEILPEEEQRELRALLDNTYLVAAPKNKFGGFEPLVPASGWLRDYFDYTLQSEPPAVFHFMCSITILGAALQRNVYIDKGYYRVFPNMATCLIAPTGRCRKTGATVTALSLARAVGVNVLSDRVTPEALTQGLSGRVQATGLVYAPELAVFLGRQRYLEGMVPLLTSLFDSPGVWSSSTIGRGSIQLKDVALCFLGASTIEWFVEALPREAFSGGFMARILFVAQQETDREYAFPIPGPGEQWEKLREDLLDIIDLKGEVVLDPDAREWYIDWYSKHRKAKPPNDLFAGYYARKPDHLLRMAMLLRIAESQSQKITTTDFIRTLRILDWLEASLPQVFDTVAGTPTGIIHIRLLQQIKASGGKISHSSWLKQNQFFMNSRDFRLAVDTLKESGCIKESLEPPKHHYYELLLND